MRRRTFLSSIVLLLLIAPVGAASAADRAVTAADPGGGAKWTARLTADGDATCVSVRRGTTAAKERWCEELGRGRVYDYNVLRVTASNPRDARTVVAVTFAPGVVRARLQTPEGAVTYRRRAGEPRVLLAVLAGLVDRPPLRAEVESGERLRIVRTAPAAGVEVPDPSGAAAWRTATEPAPGGRTCVRWERVPARFGEQPARLQGAGQCGGTALPVPVATYEVVDGRLVVLGVAGEQVRSLSLVVAGVPRGLPIEARSRAFLAVLPVGTNAATVGLVARLESGRDQPRPLDPARSRTR